MSTLAINSPRPSFVNLLETLCAPLSPTALDTQLGALAKKISEMRLPQTLMEQNVHLDQARCANRLNIQQEWIKDALESRCIQQDAARTFTELATLLQRAPISTVRSMVHIPPIRTSLSSEALECVREYSKILIDKNEPEQAAAIQKDLSHYDQELAALLEDIGQRNEARDELNELTLECNEALSVQELIARSSGSIE